MTGTYALSTLWHERHRFFPGVLAVAFSLFLMVLQSGLLLGMLAFVSRPIDHARAEIWLGSANLASVDLGQPIQNLYFARLQSQPEVTWCETYLQGFAPCIKPSGARELCMVIGCRLAEGNLGAVQDLTPDLRARLTEPGTIVADEEDLSKLGLEHVGEELQFEGRRVRLVGLVRGFRGIAGAYIFCSIRTARDLLHLPEVQTTFLIGSCRDPADALTVVKRLRGSPTISAFTREELSLRSRVHWLTKTRAGIALGGSALLGLLVGAVVTSQTLYAATVSSLKQFAVLRAMGVPRRRLVAAVLLQSGLVGIAGIVLGLPTALLGAQAAEWLGIQVLLPVWLLGYSISLCVAMAVLSGLVALHSLWRLDPAVLLR